MQLLSASAEVIVPLWASGALLAMLGVILVHQSILLNAALFIPLGGQFWTRYRDTLHDGYIPGLLMDVSDEQWKGWRNQWMSLTLFLVVCVVVSRAVRHLCILYGPTTTSYHGKENERSLHRRFFPLLCVQLSLALGFLVYLHRNNAVLCVLMGLSSFFIAKALRGSKWNPIVTWLFCMGCLLVSHSWPSLKPLISNVHPVLEWVCTSGPVRWSIYWKVSILRMISFNMDYYWACREEHKGISSSSSVLLLRKDVSPARPTASSERNDYRHRINASLSLTAYHVLHFLLYVFYVPLFLSGPIVTFNAFVSYFYSPQQANSPRNLMMLTARLLLTSAATFLFAAIFYCSAINEVDLWRTHPEMFNFCTMWLVQYATLTFTYLKFYIIWKQFRLFALLDGIGAPDNLPNCINCLLSFPAFWRSWHSSFNKWIVRYVYLPLGGRSTQIASIWLIFTFVGVWHDFSVRWISWALLNCVCFSAEMIVSMLWSRYGSRKMHPLLDYAARVGGVTMCYWGLYFAQIAIERGYQPVSDIVLLLYGKSDEIWAILPIIFSFALAAFNVEMRRRLSVEHAD